MDSDEDRTTTLKEFKDAHNRIVDRYWFKLTPEETIKQLTDLCDSYTQRADIEEVLSEAIFCRTHAKIAEIRLIMEKEIPKSGQNISNSTIINSAIGENAKIEARDIQIAVESSQNISKNEKELFTNALNEIQDIATDDGIKQTYLGMMKLLSEETAKEEPEKSILEGSVKGLWTMIKTYVNPMGAVVKLFKHLAENWDFDFLI